VWLQLEDQLGVYLLILSAHSHNTTHKCVKISDFDKSHHKNDFSTARHTETQHILHHITIMSQQQPQQQVQPQPQQVNQEQAPEQAVSSLDLSEDTEGCMIEVQCGSRVFSVKKQYLCAVSRMMDSALSGDAEATTISVDKCHEDIMEWIIRYFNDCKGVAQGLIDHPLRSKSMDYLDHHASPVDAQFMTDFMAAHDNHMKPLYKLISAANYLDIQSLLLIGCARVALQIKDVPVDKIPQKLRE